MAHVSGSYNITGNNNLVLTDSSQPKNGAGTERLLPHCLPAAAYNSYAPQSKSHGCFPGTRTQYIEDITAWATGTVQGRKYSLMWMHGPAGVGKSSIARTCARKIAALSALGASFFFSSENGIVDPAYFFSTIAYQLSRQNSDYRAILEDRLSGDPTLLAMDLETQFQKLILEPMLKLNEHQKAPGNVIQSVVMIDGLDECDNNAAQITIVETVAKSIAKHGNSMPLLWAFFSRPAPHLDEIFKHSPYVSPICWNVELHVSLDLSPEIRLYLQGSLKITQAPDWPSSDDLNTLVKLVAGLFIYAATIVRFIMNPDSLPERQLKVLISFCSDSLWEQSLQAEIGSEQTNPLSELDDLYHEIMRGVSTNRNILKIIQQVLLLHHELSRGLQLTTPDLKNISPPPTRLLANIVGLSLMELRGALTKLYPVIGLRESERSEIRSNQWGSETIFFHHASFLEFLLDRTRSKDFWIGQQCHWVSLTVRSLSLLNRMYDMNGCPRDEKVIKLDQTVFSAKPLTRQLLFRDELYDQLHERLLRWCAYSGLTAGEVLDKLRLVNPRMFRELGIESGSDELQKFPDDIRQHICSTPYIITLPPPEVRQQFNGPPEHSASEHEIKEYITHILDLVLSSTHESSCLDDFHRFVDRISSQGKSELVQSQLQDHLSSHLTNLLKKKVLNTMEKSDLLRYYVDAWKAYRTFIAMLSSDNEWIKAAVLDAWRTSFYEALQEPKHRLTHTTLELIDRRRQGDLFNKHRLHGFIHSLTQVKSNNNLPASSGNTDHGVFETDFKSLYLESTKQFYEKEAAVLFSKHNILSYLEHVQERLQEEREYIAALDLPGGTGEDMLIYTQACTEAMLKDHFQNICTEFKSLLGAKCDPKYLQLVYSLTTEISDGVNALLEIFKAHIRSSFASGASPPDTIHSVRQRHVSMAETVFAGDSRFCQAVHNVFEELQLGEVETTSQDRVKPNQRTRHGSTHPDEPLLGYDVDGSVVDTQPINGVDKISIGEGDAPMPGGFPQPPHSDAEPTTSNIRSLSSDGARNMANGTQDAVDEDGVKEVQANPTQGPVPNIAYFNLLFWISLVVIVFARA
ncbi:hypothetical protein NP233_g4635 [Leucocoprinus birnbaumii]|uniref:NACHT domain-containing protein n=1 Tax=Leucocoprinus birnbaumii TaxID=56174 RepID=A0AAD5VUA3_9AGAR|nr:hypothetical protein NP233_g4635 [Leucocoprinus birnbaumii]